MGCGRSSDVKLQTYLIITDHPHSPPQPHTCYGIPYAHNVFLQIKFSLHNNFVEFGNASGTKTIVGRLWISYYLGTSCSFGEGRCQRETGPSFSYWMRSQLYVLIDSRLWSHDSALYLKGLWPSEGLQSALTLLALSTVLSAPGFLSHFRFSYFCNQSLDCNTNYNRQKALL